MDELRELQNPESTASKTELKDIQIPRRTFLLLGAWALLNLQNKVDFNWFGESDPELSGALRREDIKHVNLRMFFGNHFLNDQSLAKLEGIKTHVITGEIHIDEPPFLTDINNPPERMFSAPFLEEFLVHLNPATSGVSSDFSDEAFRSDYNWARAYDRGMAICSTEGTNVVTTGDIIRRASEEGNLIGLKFFAASLATAAALDLKAAGLLETELTRRQFLQVLRLGSKALSAWAAAHALNSLFRTSISQGVIDEPANREATGLYSKIAALSDDSKEFVMQIQGDKQLTLEFSRIRKMRSRSMALNIWHLTHLLEGHPNLRARLAPGEALINVSATGGSGHSALKDYFSGGPEALQRSLRDQIDFVTKEFLTDVNLAPDNQGEIVEFYADIFSSLSSPRMFKKDGLEFSAENKIEIDTPQALLYRYLVDELKRKAGTIEGGAIEELFGTILKQQLEIDIPQYGKDILQVAYPDGRKGYKPKDQETIWRRLQGSGIVAEDVNPRNSRIEIYPNVLTAKYPHDDSRNVGIIFINGVPFPYFEKETLPPQISAAPKV